MSPTPARAVLALVLASAVLPASSLHAAAGAPALAPLSAPIRLSVDAREAPRKIVHARLTLPATPGPLTLHYPKWIPGEHGPTGPIASLAGLRLSAGGRNVAWTRDSADMFAFHCEVPAGATSLDVELDALLPIEGGFTAGPTSSDNVLVLSWNMVLVYPGGHAADALVFEPSLLLPEGWSLATALEETGRDAQGVRFAPTSLTRLVDAPVLAGRHFAHVTLGAGDPPHWLEIAAERPRALDLPGEWRQGLERLAAEAGALFGARHYRRYRWQLALSDHLEHFGLEHHEASDNRLGEATFASDAGRRRLGGLLAHEYVHSWNGKFRRPADLVTRDYQQLVRTDLLWVYEGLTQYLGNLLAARSGLWTPEEAREKLAQLAARFEHRPGRAWRPLGDTATAAQVVFAAPPEWASYRREADFYDEMALLWLEVDAILRRESGGARGMDDFCRVFHGGPEGPYVVKPYTRADVVATLRALAPYDWAGFFAARVDAAGAPVPLHGITAGGWKLVYDERPNVFIDDSEKDAEKLDETTSIGLVLKTGKGPSDKDFGVVQDVVPGLAAARAGVGPGMRVVAVNGRRFQPEALREALAATSRGASLELLVESADFFHTHRLDYRGGLRYPHLVRDEQTPDTLSQVLARRAP